MALRGSFTPHGGRKPESAWDPSREDLPACVTLWVEPPDPCTYTVELHESESEEHWVQGEWGMEVHEGCSATAAFPQDLAPFVRLRVHATHPVDEDWLTFLRRPRDS
jgi:hypothetical protein